MQSPLPISQVEPPAKVPDPNAGQTVQSGDPAPASERDSLVRFLIRGTLLGGVTIVALRGFLVDPDLWGHLRFGLDQLATLSVHAGDPYSFTSDRAWINHEWVFETLIALFYTIGGTAALPAFAVMMGLITLGVARAALRRTGVDGWRLDFFSIALFLAGILPLIRTARPQTFSLLLFVTLLAIMREFDRGRSRALFAVPPVFLLWANAHGGWVLGGGVIAIWALVRMMESRTPRTWLMLIGAGIASLAATLINPYGVELWRFLLETVRFERADIEEWQRVTEFTDRFVVWLVTMGVTAVCAVRFRRQDLPYVAVCTFLGVSAFLVLRIGPFFILSVLILLAPRLVRRGEGRVERLHLRSLAGATTMWALCIGLTTAGPSPVSCLRPVPALRVDERAGLFLRDNEATGKLLVWFDWGEYALWHFSPGLKVSMDGRRETVYTQATIASHLEFYRNGPGARPYLERLAPDYVWLPRFLPVSTQLAGWGWKPIFESDRSIIWSRGAVPASWRPPQLVTTTCFPAA